MNATGQARAQTLFAVVGALAVVEVASGVLQGCYPPVFTDVARALGTGDGDVNWFDAAQLVASALLVPVLAQLAPWSRSSRSVSWWGR